MPNAHIGNEEAVFCQTIHELTAAVTDAFKANRPMFPGLILLYSSIDIISSLSRPINDQDTSGAIFKDWVDAYMLPNSGLSCTSQDVWAARCGILHTLSLESRLSRFGNARVITYVDRSSAVDDLRQRIDPAESRHVVVALRPFARAFFTGVISFSQGVSSNQMLQQTVYHHVRTLAAVVPVNPRGVRQPGE
jgi:hypothetical protein